MPFRKPLLLTSGLAAAVLLAGCTAGGGSGTASSSPSASAAASATPSASAIACASPGSASDAVKVTGSGSAAPKASFPTPTTVSTTQRTVVKQGSGEAVKQGASVKIAYTFYDAKTGKQLDQRGYGKTEPVVFSADTTQILPGIVQALVCAKTGERLAAVIPASAAFGDTGSSQLGVGKGDSLVLVADVVGLTPTKASGTAKALPAGFPTVTLAADGKPTVTIPKSDPPKTLKIADAKVGTGETVKSGDTMTLQYQGVLWRNGEVFDQSWGKAPTSFATNQVVKGFGKALVGQKVGSQVVAIIPPSEGYGSKGQGDIKGTDTMVFVIDVLDTAHAS